MTSGRRSIRLRHYDYSQAGAYFVTICAQNKLCLFGDIVNGVMQLNEAGLMTERWFGKLENKFQHFQRDGFVCMPNHIHFVVVNVGAGPCVRPGSSGAERGRTRGSAPTGLAEVVQWFKTMTTNEYIRGVKRDGWQPFPKRLWQRNYWERVIRDESELMLVREYIQNNPAQWELDKLNPACCRKYEKESLPFE